MKIHRLDHVGFIVQDLAAAKEFFLDLGLEVQGETGLESELLDAVTGLKNTKTEVIMLRPRARGDYRGVSGEHCTTRSHTAAAAAMTTEIHIANRPIATPPAMSSSGRTINR